MSHYLPSDAADWVQLVVLAVVVYWLLRLARGTIAASILRGTFILISLAVFIAAFVLRAFELRILQAILTSLLGTMVIALLVVFQPELRRALLSLGEHRFFARFRARPRTCVDELTRAVVTLSRERHGALFAVERRNALHHIVGTGVHLDAEARSEVLAALFWPGAPLHDGGAVLRGDRIVAAACIFPLAERRDLDLRYGTRHRAALGLSEESDAIVAVVSEETGRVSLAVGGELRPVEPPSDLARMLGELLGPPARRRAARDAPGEPAAAPAPVEEAAAK